MIDTKAVRALAKYRDIDVADSVRDMLRQCADEIDTLRELVREVFDPIPDDWAERAEKALGEK
jgi:hypothetical protein